MTNPFEHRDGLLIASGPIGPTDPLAEAATRAIKNKTTVAVEAKKMLAEATRGHAEIAKLTEGVMDPIEALRHLQGIAQQCAPK